MAYEYDVCVIGLGPAGMAASIAATHMGLRVLGIDSRGVGGECTRTGCIPSKALIRIAHTRHAAAQLPDLGLAETREPASANPFREIAERTRLAEAKAQSLLAGVDLALREGPAAFADAHTIDVGGKRHTAKRIFVCVGSRPAVPSIPGLREAGALTSDDIFSLDRIPSSLVVIGGGAVGCEVAQAFHRLGSRVSLVHMDEHLLPQGDGEAGRLLQAAFAKEGIEVHGGRRISEVTTSAGGVAVRTNLGDTLRGERVFVATGRRFEFSDLRLGNAGVEFSDRGIQVDATLRTTARHIYAPGDANGACFLSSAAAHQGMIAAMNSVLPAPLRRRFRSYVVPWATFTEPEVAHVGWLERDLKAHDMPYEIFESKYEDYGPAIAEGMAEGSVRVYASSSGRIYGVRIVGRGATEMINEWGLAIQSRLRLDRILFLQHSYPSMSFLSKRAADRWGLERLRDPFLRKLVKLVR
jgi:pyruvate/2-oxoglutarate dehydrogenase complex dihydrolipoamide dehydrogenase (E3) component